MSTARRSKKQHTNYSSNIFINCPFDSDYKSIFHALVFSISDCGFIPRCALERDGTEEVRIEKIMSIIEECKYGIHDISRTESDKSSNLPRFNMPLELGIFIGCKKYSDSEKSYIIFDTEKYRYQQFISDIAGQDIKAHNNNPSAVINKVRDYLRNKSGRVTIPSGNTINARFAYFTADLPEICRKLNWDANDLEFIDYYHCVKAWLTINASAS